MTDKLIENKIFDFQYKQKLVEKDKNLSQESQNEKKNYYDQVIALLQNLKSLNLSEPENGKCSINDNSWKAGLTDIKQNDNSKVVEIIEYKYFSECKPFKVLENDFINELKGKIIIGWEIKSHHDNEKGGSFERFEDVLGRNKIKFKVKSEFWRGCDWRLKLWTINDS